MQPGFEASAFRDFIRQMLARWQVPGAAVAIIKDGQVILCEGFGQRNPAHNLPVTPDTLFQIASCTKSFTAACLGLLIDEGKLDWDTPIIEYLPSFRLYDSHATQLLTARDLLCHRSGLPAYDSMYYETDYTRREILACLAYAEPSCSLRTKFQYQNMMYMLAGILVEERSGQSWETFVQQRIFEPLGMRRSNTSTTVTQADLDHSRPHLFKNGALGEIPFLEAHEGLALSAAGAIASCANDLAKWLALQMNGETLAGRIELSPATLAEMHKPNIFIDWPRTGPGFEFFSYGLGWFLESYKGHPAVWHDGETQGFASMMSFLPWQKIGVAILTNADRFHNPLPYYLPYMLYDQMLGLEPTDWNALYEEMYGLDEAPETAAEPPAREEQPAAPPRPLEEYLGEYTNPAHGSYSVCRDGRGLYVLRNRTVMPMDYLHDQVFRVTYQLYDMPGEMTFLTDSDGKISGFSIPLEPAVKDIFFTRVSH